jgi:hypothetical protein
MSEIDDLEAYTVPDLSIGKSRSLIKKPRGKRLSDAEADRIFERVKAEIARQKEARK